MESDRWQRIEEIFQAATEMDPAARERYLSQACAQDAACRREVEVLIEAHERAGNFIETSPPWDTFALPERRLGPYELIREIGHGGMGTVYLAERADDEFRQRVAIKLVQAGMDLDSIVERFRKERQILAGLEHPNIARLLDGGTAASRLPYFVMEYVDGRPIGDFCDERKLSIVERLKLFQSVCGAVHYAHQNLVVHRDIKPGNILVTAAGVPKLLDFGIAKLISTGDPADATRRTSQIMTPGYASPEQVSFQPVTTASDVYSLGVLLYELLTRERPYRVTSRSPVEMAQAICEQEPRKPSSVCLELKGDLDNIILKTIQKEPARRYGSVVQLSEDIDRYLSGLPVLARTSTLRYRAGKFARRHKAGVLAVALIAVSLVGGGAATLWQARVATMQRERAERRFNDVRKLANSFMTEFDDAIKDLPGSTPARALLVKRALEYLGGLAAESRGDHKLQLEMAQAYENVAEIQGNPQYPNLGDVKGALASYRKALEIREDLLRVEPQDIESRRQLAGLYGLVSDVLIADGDTAGAVKDSGRAAKMYASLAAHFPQDRAFQSEWTANTYKHAGQLDAAGDIDQAMAGYRAAADLSRQMLRARPADPDGKIHMATSVDGIGSILQQKGDTAGALENRRQSFAIREELAATQPNNTHYRRQLGFAHHNLGLSLAEAGDLSGALRHFQAELNLFEALQSADPQDTQARRNVSLAHKQIGDALVRNADWKGALIHYETALKIDRVLAGDAPENSRSLLDLTFSEGKYGMVLGKLGRRGEAVEMMRHGIATQQVLLKLDPGHDRLRGFLANSYTRMAQYFAEGGDLAGALEYYGKAIHTREELSARNPANKQNLGALAECYLNFGKAMTSSDRKRALEDDRKAVELLERLAAADLNNAHYRLNLADATGSTARLYAGMRNWRTARQYYLRSAELWSSLERGGKLAPADLHWPRDVAREIAACDRAAGRSGQNPAPPE